MRILKLSCRLFVSKNENQISLPAITTSTKNSNLYVFLVILCIDWRIPRDNSKYLHNIFLVNLTWTKIRHFFAWRNQTMVLDDFFYSCMWLYRIKLQLFKYVIKPFFSMTSFYAYQLSYEPCILSFSYNSPILTFVYMFSHATSLQYQSCTFWCSSVICTSANV